MVWLPRWGCNGMIFGSNQKLLMASSGAVKTVIQNTDNLTDISDLSTYTYTGVSFGDADATRHIIVAGMSGSTSSATPSSITIAGITPTLAAEGAGTDGSAFIYFAKVTTGATGTIEFTFSSSQRRSAISVFAVYNLDALSVEDYFVTNDLSGSQLINTVRGGVLIGTRYAGNAGSDLTLTWSNSISAASVRVEDVNPWETAYSLNLSASDTLSWSTTGSPANRQLAVASFSP